MRAFLQRARHTFVFVLAFTYPVFGSAADDNAPSSSALEPEQICTDGACTLTYDAAFFDRYAPVTALDMVNNLPGFVLRDGDTDSRGFGGAAGNIIINGARISAKSTSPSDFLGRIPAADVERIEVIRGQVGGLDLRGENVVANVIRRGQSASGAWAAGALTTQPGGGLYSFAEMSYSASSEAGEVTLALIASEQPFVLDRRELLLSGADVLQEERTERFFRDEEFLNAALNATSEWAGWSIAANLARTNFERDGGELSRRIPSLGSGDGIDLFQGDYARLFRNEVGLDAERALSDDWRFKVIGLYRDEDRTDRGSLVRGPVREPGIAEVETNTLSLGEELIGRIELDFSGLAGHTLELSAEYTENTLESRFGLRELEGGVLLTRDVPGADTEVTERRIDILLSDSFQLGDISIDAALGGEDSTVSQIGGFTEDRSFFFWKPSVAMSYSPDKSTQWRLRALRNVGQLDLQDFVSGADLGDVELALGNPQLSPETTTTVDLSYEIRGDGIGIGSVTLFHDMISDVNDLLPLTGQLEIPGNIGDGTRSGVRWEFTLPLDPIGLPGGRVDGRGSWQTSSVDDPLTGESRALSGERDWFGVVEFRQDLPAHNFAWGALAFTFDRFPLFGLDEFDRVGQRRDMDVFIESRAIDGLLLRLTIEDVFRDGESRDRLVFAGDRSVQPLAFRELREQRRGRTFTIEFRGEF